MSGDVCIEGTTAYIYSNDAWTSLSLVASGTIAPTISTTGTLIGTESYYIDTASQTAYRNLPTTWDHIPLAIANRISGTGIPVVTTQGIVGAPINCYVGTSDAAAKFNAGDFYFNTSTLQVKRRKIMGTIPP